MLSGCINPEELRKKEFIPTHAATTPTALLILKPENGVFAKYLVRSNEPTMLLKKGLGYSIFQLQNGKIGEVANEHLRLAKPNETFAPPPKLTEKREEGEISSTAWGGEKYPPTPQKSSEEQEETFPIDAPPFQSVEPELPTW